MMRIEPQDEIQDWRQGPTLCQCLAEVAVVAAVDLLLEVDEVVTMVLDLRTSVVPKTFYLLLQPRPLGVASDQSWVL